MKITYNKANIFDAEGVRLFPGVNHIPPSRNLAAFLENPVVNCLVDNGDIKLETDTKKLRTTDDDLIDDMPHISDVVRILDLSKSSNPALAHAAQLRLDEIRAPLKKDTGALGDGKST